MTTKISLYSGPAAGFDEPFEMLLACHERIERMLCLLEKIVERITASGLDQDCKDAAKDVMRYFDLAGPAHHRDEELHVLPLLSAGTAEAQKLAAQIKREHLLMSEQWRFLRQDLAAIFTLDNDAADSSALPRGWRQRGEAFASLHRAHIAVEESMIFKEVREQLDQAAIEQMGQEMAKRRQSVAH